MVEGALSRRGSGEYLSDADRSKKERSLVLKLQETDREIDRFNAGAYSEMDSFLRSIKNNPELRAGDIFEKKIDDCIAELSNFRVLDLDFYRDLNGDPDLKQYFEHDIQKIATSLLTTVELLVDMKAMMDSEDKIDSLNVINESWPQYSAIMRDVMHRKLEKDPEFKVLSKEVDMDFADKALKNFAKVLASDTVSVTKFKRENPNDKTKNLQPLGEVASLQGILSPDEYVDVPDSLLLNSIFNVLRNSSTKFVDAGPAGVKLTAEKQGTDLVIQVRDNGIGLSSEQLDPKNEKFIFSQGEQKSGQGSTGLGLAHLDKRMERGGGMIRVASRKRGQTVDEMHTYPANIDQ